MVKGMAIIGFNVFTTDTNKFWGSKQEEMICHDMYLEKKLGIFTTKAGSMINKNARVYVFKHIVCSLLSMWLLDWAANFQQSPGGSQSGPPNWSKKLFCWYIEFQWPIPVDIGLILHING